MSTSTEQTAMLGYMQAKKAVADATLQLQVVKASADAAGVSDEWVHTTLACMDNVARSAALVLEACKHVLLESAPSSPALFGTLPADVLAEIYKTVAVAGDRSMHRRDARRVFTLQPAFALASVSRHWRAVALDTPSIWRSVTLDCTAVRGAEEFVVLVLVRSRACPFERVALHNVPLNKYFCLPSHLVFRLFAHTQRLEIGWLEADQPELFGFNDTILTMFQAPLPSLRSIAILNKLPLEFSPIPNGVKLLTLAPRLEQIALGDLDFDSLDLQYLPLLKTFSSDRKLSEAQARTLTASPSLTTLYLRSVDPEQPWSGVPLEFHAVEDLVSGDGLLRMIQSPAKVPRLASLQYHGSLDPLMHFFHLSQPCTSLTTLEIDFSERYIPVDHALFAVVALLAMPNLRVLMLVNGEELCDFFKAWTAPSTICLPPKLSTLKLEECAMDTHVVQALSSFLMLRAAAQDKAVSTGPNASENSTNTRIERLEIAQRGAVRTEQSILPPWLQSRLAQLVKRVVVDTDGAFV